MNFSKFKSMSQFGSRKRGKLVNIYQMKLPTDKTTHMILKDCMQ